ncbi:angiopoietin-related protein 7-like [Drosophila grimshawi]|uniref:angiopoietin-related protein 7-like n=1 Tax=Drosophila grimshawi TaxID=7222 RepID=UPI000C86ED46|nr:angiopoietin-related protein 7-like [Drosophila grimshawi]
MELNWVAFTLCISLILIKGESSFVTTATKNEICKASRIEEEQCGSYAYKAIKPLLIYMELMRTEVENHDNITSIKNSEIEKQQLKISQLELELREQINKGMISSKDNELKQLQQKLDQKNECETRIEKLKNYNNRTAGQDPEIKELLKKLVDQNENVDAIKSKEFQKQLEEHKKSIEEKNQQISKLQNDVKQCVMKLEDPKQKPIISCTSFGDVPGAHQTNFSNYSFDVLCDTETAGPGWTVIQQRIDGKEDFNRSWTTYRKGFGSFDGDFFLGLEKIHRLTSYKPHELYIHLEHFNGDTEYARYQQFAIAGESDEYQLSISGLGGNVTDMMSQFNNQKFSTYDRDNNGRNDVNCALENLGGWWYPAFCGWGSLNSKYYDSHDDGQYDGIPGLNPVKNVRMLIRPT